MIHRLAILLILSTATAIAGENAPIQEIPSSHPAAPCRRTTSHVEGGGIDLDSLNCKLFVMQMTMETMEETIISLTAMNKLLESDLENANRRIEELTRDNSQLKLSAQPLDEQK